MKNVYISNCKNNANYKKGRYVPISKYIEEEVNLVYCSPIGNYNSIDICQVIIFHNGYCKVGPDVWRELQHNDTSSHPVKCFKTIDALQKNYVFRPELGCFTKKITKKIRRKYA